MSSGVESEAETTTMSRLLSRINRLCNSSVLPGLEGFGGSLRPGSIRRVLDALQVEGCTFVDVGYGDGRVLLQALALGASKAVGFELPGNSGRELFVKTLAQRCGLDPGVVTLHHTAIQDAATPLPGSCLFAFWEGWGPAQGALVEALGRSPAIKRVVFTEPAGLFRFEPDVRTQMRERGFEEVESFPGFMSGSGSQKPMLVFARQ